MKRIGVLTSGGDAPGMNAAIRAVVRAGIYYGCKVYGINRGYCGLLEEDFEEMELSSVGDIIQKGGTILKSSRCEEFRTDSGLKKASEILKKHQIDYLIAIGGDGTFKGLEKLSAYGIPSIGIPATIDNDLAYTDYTIGFDTAISTATDAISKIRDTSASHERIHIVEVMGRECGDLALYTGLAGGAEAVLIPEEEMTVEDIAFRLKTTQLRGKKHSIIILSEGVHDITALKQNVEKETGFDLRLTILGHVQRGGNPTAFDRILASRLGIRAIELIMEGSSTKVVGIARNEIVDVEIQEALDMKKEIRKDFYEMIKILSI
ncbi:MAG: 6-phosphofructokinase [Clostridioides sp.]|jgi:6-phosphofructokinase 1|nr:6-phosphofructokinase [Clostridioides sp.]